MLAMVVVLRDARRAYKLHTIALTPFPLQPCNSATHVSKEDCASTFAIDLFNAPVRSSGKMKEETGEKERERERERERILRNEKKSMKNVHASVSITKKYRRKRY